MTVAIDSSCLIAIFKNERTGARWLDFILALRAEHQLLACDVVWAEVAPLFDDVAALAENMSALGISFSALDEAAAFTAGQLFSQYRSRGGIRARVIPDFLIAAHALRHKARLATADDHLMSRQFPTLKILQP